MIDIEVEDQRWVDAAPEFEGVVRAAAETVAGPRGSGRTVAILLTDDQTMRELCRRFRGKDSPTNVLAFPAQKDAHGHLGDIALAFGVCQREAREQEKTLADHLRHLVVHGMLHLMGYDHQGSAEAVRMERMEIELLARLGVRNPYADTPLEEVDVERR